MDVAAIWTTYGGLGLLCGIQTLYIKTLWVKFGELQAQSRTDQQAMLPALTEASAAVRTALEESIRSRALAERERQ